MAFVRTLPESPKVGDWVTTTIKHEACIGYFEPGTRVKIVAVEQMRGYSLEDEEGNRLIECGWTI